MLFVVKSALTSLNEPKSATGILLVQHMSLCSNRGNLRQLQTNLDLVLGLGGTKCTGFKPQSFVNLYKDLKGIS